MNPTRSFQIVQCLRCKWIWDDDDMDDYVCPCINDYGNRQVIVISEGTTNMPKTIPVSTWMNA